MKRNTNLKIEQKPSWNWKRVLTFLFIIWMTSIIIGMFISSEDLEGNVAVIDVKGPISNFDTSGFVSSGGANPDTIISFIDKAESNPQIKAVVFEVNSGGGSPVASDEISQRIKRMNKTSVAFIRDIGASGAYWIASNTDYILVNRMSLVGSIGVTGAYLSFEDFLKKYNITYNRMVAGKYKDMGSPYKELTDEEEALFNDLLFDLRDEFINEVANNRNMTYQQVEPLATGLVWHGTKALELGLIDAVGSQYELEQYLKGSINETVDFVHYQIKPGLREMLYGFSMGVGKSVGNGLGESITNDKLYIR